MPVYEDINLNDLEQHLDRVAINHTQIYEGRIVRHDDKYYMSCGIERRRGLRIKEKDLLEIDRVLYRVV